MERSLSPMEVTTILVVLCATLSWLNYKVLKLPQAIGLLVMGMMLSFSLLTADFFIPGVHFSANLHGIIKGIDLFQTIIHGMLSSLLFAAALHIDLRALRSVKIPILALATVGVLISTASVGGAVWLAALALGVDLPIAWALVFGALISPTDPVAVLSVLKAAKVPKSLSAKIAGESLFNDGVGLVAFTVLLAVAMASSGYEFDAHGSLVTVTGAVDVGGVAEVFLVEVFGALVLGTAAGFMTVRMIKGVDDAAVETLMSLALVLGLYMLCTELHMSGPIAVVVAGLIVGNFGASYAMSERTKKHLFPFWEMLDSILNAMLFLLIGLEVLVLDIDAGHVAVAVAAVPLVLLGRFVSVYLPVNALRMLGHTFSKGTVRIMTWGGVRGGISVALALSLPDVPYKPTILTVTYVIVVFTVVVQGLTIAPLARRLSAATRPSGAAPAERR